MNRYWGWTGALWGVTGVVLVLGFAVYRLAGVTLDAFNYPLQWHHWMLLIANVLFMAYSAKLKMILELGIS